MRDVKHRFPVQNGPSCKWNGGVRHAAEIDVVCVHTAESPWDAADGVAAYGSRTNRKVSWHVVVDNKKAIRQLSDLVVAWTAPPKNRDGLHVEICGRAAATKLAWYRNQANLKRAAWICAKWARGHGIPVRWLTDRQLKLGYMGFTTHGQVSRVFGLSDHYDPGKNFPSRYFLGLVRRRVGWLEAEGER
jgi:hypothetical protein